MKKMYSLLSLCVQLLCIRCYTVGVCNNYLLLCHLANVISKDGRVKRSTLFGIISLFCNCRTKVRL